MFEGTIQDVYNFIQPHIYWAYSHPLEVFEYAYSFICYFPPLLTVTSQTENEIGRLPFGSVGVGSVFW